MIIVPVRASRELLEKLAVEFTLEQIIGLRTFEAFEAISLGILRKRALWETLQVPQSIVTRVCWTRLSRSDRSRGTTVKGQ
jgi:hypothetical protein